MNKKKIELYNENKELKKMVKEFCFYLDMDYDFEKTKEVINRKAKNKKIACKILTILIIIVLCSIFFLFGLMW